MALRGEDDSEQELDVVFENENNLLKGVPKQDLTPGTYTVTVTVTDGLTIPLNHSSSWWVFSYGVPPTPVEEPSPTVVEKVVLPPREEVPVWGFPPPENIVVEGAAPAQEFSAHFGPYSAVVNRIEVTLSENVRVELRFENLENIPPGIPEPENLIIYACFRILLNVPENIVQETRVTFSVDKSWIEQRVKENTVALHKYIEENGLWKSLPTIQTDKNGTHVFYSAWAEGLSVFVVGGVPRVVQPPPLEEQVLEEPQVPAEEPPVPIEEQVPAEEPPVPVEEQVPAEEPQLLQERRPLGERPQLPEGGGLMLVLLAVALLILVIFWFW
jgi:PGF-pre-PGF domain-containing protein